MAAFTNDLAAGFAAGLLLTRFTERARRPAERADRVALMVVAFPRPALPRASQDLRLLLALPRALSFTITPRQKQS